MGLQAEWVVAGDLHRKGWVLLFHRAKTSIAEVDLVLQKGNSICLIEVKTLDDPWRAFQRISHRQVQKLLLNQIQFSRVDDEFFISCRVAWVSGTRVSYTHVN